MSGKVDKSIALGGFFRDWTRKCREKLAGAADESEVFLGLMAFGQKSWLDHQPPSEAVLQETLLRLRDGLALDETHASVANYLVILGAVDMTRTGQMGNDPSMQDVVSVLLNAGVNALYNAQLDHLDKLEDAGRFTPGGGGSVH